MTITDVNGTTISPTGGWRILANSTARKTINLGAAPISGNLISITDTVGDAASNNITINANGSERIDGAASITININNGRKVLRSTGGGWTVVTTSTDVNAGAGGGATVAGSNTEIQFNNNGALGASDKLTFDGSELSLSSSIKIEGIKQTLPINLDASDAYDGQRNFSKEYYWTFSNIGSGGGNGWNSFLQVRPYQEGTTTVVTTAIWSAIRFEVHYWGHQNGSGNFSYHGVGYVDYVDGQAQSSSPATQSSLGTNPGFQIAVNSSTATFQIRGGGHASGTDGSLYVKIWPTTGAGGSAASSTWDIQDVHS